MATAQSLNSIYVVGPLDGCYKIGRSADPDGRVSSLNLPAELKPLAVIGTGRHGWLESYLHTAFAHRRTRGEWFRLTDEEVALVCSIGRADVATDLPPAVVALREANEAAKRVVKQKYTTFRIYRTEGEILRQLATSRGQTIADVVRDLFGDVLNKALVDALNAQLVKAGN